MPEAPRFPAGQVTPIQANELVSVVNNLDNTNIVPSANIDQTKLSSSTLHKSAMYVDSNGTPALTNNQVIYRGWGVTGNIGATSGTDVVTLPNGGFSDANYDVAITYLGEKATAPTSRTDVNIFANGTASSHGAAQTSTQFTASFFRTAGGNLAFVAYSWIAVGTKT